MTAEVIVMGELRTIADLMLALAGQQPLAATAKTVARIPVNWGQGNESVPRTAPGPE